MILYHGSNQIVEQIDHPKSNRYKDYTSDLFASLQRPTTGLYNQSTGYLTTYLMRELQN